MKFRSANMRNDFLQNEEMRECFHPVPSKFPFLFNRESPATVSLINGRRKLMFKNSKNTIISLNNAV
jgi:hypothetical protein